ncbi:MAG: hypothetical protein V1825_00445 [Candidatus Falkowbacteria bacterium]
MKNLIEFGNEGMSRVELAILMMQIINLQLISMPLAFALSHQLGLFSDNLYTLFENYKPLQEDIPEFLGGYLKYLQKGGSDDVKR